MSELILKNALKRLPEYEPPRFIWEEIEAGLETDDLMREGISSLPEYTPPAEIWENIAENLAKQPVKPGILLHFSSYRLWIIAASFSLLILAAWWLLNPSPNVPAVEEIAIPQPELPKHKAASPLAEIPLFEEPNRTKTSKSSKRSIRPNPAADITITQQKIDNQIMLVGREQEDPAFELVKNLCNDPMPVCESPAFKLLKKELDELTIAQTELRAALGNYADDPDLVAQMVQIERDRSVLLQHLIQLI